jgi:hypothetical protein
MMAMINMCQTEAMKIRNVKRNTEAINGVMASNDLKPMRN